MKLTMPSLPRTPGIFSVFILCLPLFSSGCSIKFLYNQLDWIVPWYVDDYVSLNDQQELVLDQRLSHYLAQHRKQQLPVYADYFHRVAEMFENGLTEPEVSDIFENTEKFRTDIFASIPGSFSHLFKDLRDEQVREVGNNLERELQEQKERFIDMDKIRQREIRAEEMTDFLYRLLGNIRDEQRSLIEQWSKLFILIGPEFIESRTRWQNQLLQLLKQRHQLNDFDQRLSALFSDRYQGRSAEHQEKFDHNKQLLKQLYLGIDNTLDSYQRNQLLKKIRSYADDFKELAEQ